MNQKNRMALIYVINDILLDHSTPLAYNKRMDIEETSFFTKHLYEYRRMMSTVNFKWHCTKPLNWGEQCPERMESENLGGVQTTKVKGADVELFIIGLI